MPLRHFFIRGQYICSAPAEPHRVHSELCQPYGRAFFCPLCSEVWALAPVEGQPTHCHHAFCDKHHPEDPVIGTWNFGHIYSWDVPGSLWISYENQWNLDLPKEILEREFMLLMGQHNSELSSPLTPQGESNG